LGHGVDTSCGNATCWSDRVMMRACFVQKY